MLADKFDVANYEEFLKIDKENEKLLEYIEGYIYNQAAPSTMHQKISVRLTVEFSNYLEGKECEVFHAPFDIILKNNKEQNVSKVMPDLAIICDKEGLNEKNYIGVPSLIVEILSPSNQSHDLITKMNLYQKFGVKEYWIINPMLKSVQIYALNIEGYYEQVGIYKNSEVANSSIFKDLNVELNKLFI